MARDTIVTAAEWLNIRSAVAQKLKSSGSQQQEGTREKIAETLLTSGYLDIEFIREELNPVKPEERGEGTYPAEDLDAAGPGIGG